MITDRTARKPAAEIAERWTYERYLRETADGEYFSAIGGQRLMSPSPNRFLQRGLIKLAARLEDFVEREKRGKVFMARFDVYFSEDNFVQPDLLFIAKEHAAGLTDQGVRGAPDIVVEVLSPGSKRADRVTKRDLYAKHGAPEYWIISPDEQTIEVLKLREARYETDGLYEIGDNLVSPTLSGFSCPLTELFEE
jgi:Uma2 family endonuclease